MWLIWPKKPRRTNISICKPFEKVTSVVIRKHGHEKLLELQKWFPNAFKVRKSTRQTRKEMPASQNLADGEDVSDTNIKELKLTDLNEYCLEVIFEHLNATELTNVAEAKKHFVSTAKLIYKRKYSERQLVISDSGHTLKIKGEGELKVTLTSLLEHFGKLLLNIKIGSNNWTKHHWCQAEQLINDHCVDTLKYIDLSYFSDVNRMVQNRKPFISVEDVLIARGHGCNILPSPGLFWYDFDEMFPQVRRLKLGSDFHFLKLMQTPLRHLEQVDLYILKDALIHNISGEQWINFMYATLFVDLGLWYMHCNGV